MNMNDWEDLDTFEKSGSKIAIPFISISLRRTISLSAGFIHHAKDQISDMTHVILSFSRSKNAIVFSFTKNEDMPGSIKISGNNNSNTNLAARSFFNYYEINIEEAEGRYIAKLENIPNKGKLWVVYLNNKN